MRTIRWIMVAVVSGVFVAAGAHAVAGDFSELEPFYGTYRGMSISTTEVGLDRRDLDVKITPTDGGFQVQWTTIKLHRDGRTKRKSYAIGFRSSKRHNIYTSAMKRNKFGAAVPLNPMLGEPYVWARLEGRTLTVYALMITDTGTYEIQVYERTLRDDGLDLVFNRYREDIHLKAITGRLDRIE